MRLGQLARKLGVRTVEIVDYLAQHQIRIEDGFNSRVEDEHVTLLTQRFSPAVANALSPQQSIAATTEQPPPVTVVEESGVADPPASKADLTEGQTKAEEKIELIKAPKVELSGLKVLGKIDLPVPKMKEVSPESSVENSEPEKKQRQDFRKPYTQRRDRPNQPSKNPIALQREREAHEANEKRRAELELEKEKRAMHYRKKVKEAPPTKRVRMVEEPVEELSAAALVEPPRTWWGKFIKWLNT